MIAINRKPFVGLILLMGGLLGACSSNPYAIQPNPVPDVDAALNVTQLWQQGAGDGLDDKVGVSLRPAIVGKQIFAADVNGSVSGFTLQPPAKGFHLFGSKRIVRDWQKLTNTTISSGVYAGYDRVVFGTRNGQVVALSADDGSQVWTRSMSSEVLSTPASDGYHCVFLTQDGQIVALDLATGEELWNYTVSVPKLTLRGSATPLIKDGVVYIGLASGKVLALDVKDGTPIWQQQVAVAKGTSQLDRLVDIDNNLIVHRGGVFVSGYQGKVAVLGAKQGHMFWARDLSSHTPMSSLDGKLFVATSDGDIVAVNERNGAFVWTQNALHGRRLVGSVVQNGYVVTGDYEGWLYWLDPVTGKLLASYHAADAFAGPLQVVDDILYVMGANGSLSAYRVTDKT